MKKNTKNQLVKRMSNYIERTGHLSPINNLEYQFLRGLYIYLTKQNQTKDYVNLLYKAYVKLVNIGYFPNREEQCPILMDTIHKQLLILLERDYVNEYSFIMLNNENHYNSMKHVLELLKRWSDHPEYYGFASEKEFQEDLLFLRKEFREFQLDVYQETGKWPKKFRKRFSRI